MVPTFRLRNNETAGCRLSFQRPLMSEKPCGLCRVPMKIGRYGPLTLDFCLPCDRVWFDSGEIGILISGGPQVVSRLIELMKNAGTSGKTSVDRPTCPTCRCILDGVDYPGMAGLRLDRCEFCEGYLLSRADLNDLGVALGGGSIFEAETRRASIAKRHEPAPPVERESPAAVERPSTTKAGGLAPCGKCGQHNGPDAPMCWACGAALKAAILARCPRCEAPMRELSAGGAGIGCCQGCGLVWTNPQRLNRLLLLTEPQRKAVAAQARDLRPELRRKLHPELRCPKDGQKLKPARLPAVLQEPVPACPVCFGVLLLPGMLEQALSRG